VTLDDVRSSPLVSDPLRLLDICATSDGAAALVVTSVEWARAHGYESPVTISGISTITPSYPNPVIDLPNFATDSAAGTDAPASVLGAGVAFKDSIADRAYAEAGIGPDDLDLAEVYDLSTALELDWYENIGLCPPGEAERLLRDGDTTIGGRIPVNASGGLACFGEAVPAQAIAQVCELTWQVRGVAGERQVEGARVGLSVNQGLFGHGSAVVVTR
ncbi:MAG TPA: lipid-transfer protein, partial [Acidimicrobiia bacterium]